MLLMHTNISKKHWYVFLLESISRMVISREEIITNKKAFLNRGETLRKSQIKIIYMLKSQWNAISKIFRISLLIERNHDFKL